MTTELRLILLALSLFLLAGIWWWGARKSSQAPGRPELRDTSSLEPPRREPPTAESSRIDAVLPPAEPSAHSRDWGVPPFEPLSISTAEYDRVPILDGEMMVQADPVAADPAIGLQSEHRETIAATPARIPDAREKQKIISIRVCSTGDSRWSGAALLQAFESHGLAYGRYQVFHRKHADGRSLFCVASLAEPGSFDVEHMATDEFRGVTLFAVLPGPLEPLLTLDELLSAARGLAQDLSGMLQDSKGVPLSPQRTAALREEVARFQASLPGP